LLDLGVERFLLSSTISGVLAQRLVRKLCDCARPASPSPALRQQFSQLSIPVIDLSNIREAAGCEACGGTGYRGRTAVSELLVIDEPMRSTIGRRHQDQRELELLARNSGFRTLYEDGLAKVAAGETTLQEVLRVTRAG
jgi:general secretion pathway protein E